MSIYSVQKLPSDIIREIAFKVKVIRKNKKMTQVELARKSGVSYGSIKRFEQTGQISFESLLQVLHILGRLNEFDSILEVENKRDIEKLFSPEMRAK